MNKTKIEIELVTYDGTYETLPKNFVSVLVSGKENCSAYRVSDTWIMHNIACGARLIQKGDRWAYVPEIEEQTDDCR